MKICRNLLIGFFYPEAKQYFKYYFQSVNKQNTNNFELLILIDNTRFVIPKLKIKFHIIKVSKITSITSLRNLALKFAKKNNYKNIIFSDTDDYFSYNRVSQSIKYLKKYDFVFNNIYKINGNNKSNQTPLHKAAFEGRDKIVNILIQNGANVNPTVQSSGSFNGMTPLDFALTKGKSSTADLLRKHGAKTGEELKAEGK